MDSDKKTAGLVKQRLTKAQDLFEPVADSRELNRNLYKGYLQTDENYEWDYALVDQQVFPLIRNYIARSNPSMTKIRLEARKDDDIERRQVNQDFVNWEIGELPLTTLLTRAFFSNYITGKAYFKTGWKYDPRVLVTNEGHDYEMRPLTNRADLKFVRFNNILVPNRNIPDLYEQPYFFELMQLRVGDMLKDNATYGYEFWDKKFIADLKKGGVTGKLLNYEADFVTDSDTKDEMAFQSATFPSVCMKTLENDVIYVPLVGDTDRIINKQRENPFWHGHYDIIDMTAFPEDDEFYSMSVVDAVGDNQIASTEVLNQMLTNIRGINNEMWISGSSAAATPDYMFKKRPDGIIRVAGDPTQITNVRQQDSTSSMLRVKQELNTGFEKIGGISSLYSSGAGEQSINQTARGAQVIDKNIETNIQMILDLFGEQVLERVGDHFQQLNAQYVTEDQTFHVTGKKGVRSLIQIKPDEVSANFDVYTYPEAMIKQTPASRQASLQNFLGVLKSDVQGTGVQVDVVPVVEALIDAYPEMENIEDIVIDTDEKAKRDYLSLERGQLPDIKVRDDHTALLQVVSIHFEDNQANYTPDIVKLFMDYAKKHMQYLQAAKQIAAEAAMAVAPKPPTTSINFKDLPPDGQQQLAAQDRLNINPQANVGGTVPGNEGTGQPAPYNLTSLIGGGAQ
jgi:hypothetical protein